MNGKTPKNLAILYFEGTIAPEDEILLNDFLGTDSEHWKQFRAWEEEWRAGRTASRSDLLMYNRITAGIRRGRNRRILSGIWYAAAAVAAAVIVAGTVYSVLRPDTSGMSPEETLITVPDRMRTNIVLADGSSVWLNSASVLRYGPDFGTSSRDVYVEGEAFFEVSPDKEHPFHVHLPSGTVKVTGTRFNVSCYETTGEIQVALLEGSVCFVSDDGTETAMTAGELLDYDIASGTTAVSRQRVGQYAAWIDGRIDFESITLEALFRRLSAQFGVNITYDLGPLADTEFRLLLNNSESIEDILHALSLIVPISFTGEMNGGIYVVGQSEQLVTNK